MKNLSNHISQYSENKNKKEEYVRKLPSRTFLVTPWNGDFNDVKLFMKNTTELYKYSLELETIPLYQRGLVYFYNETGIEKFVFLEVHAPKQMNDNFRILPSEQYQCRLFSNEESDKAYENFTDNPNIPTGTIIVVTEMYDANINNDLAPIEIQLFGNFFNNKFTGK